MTTIAAGFLQFEPVFGEPERNRGMIRDMLSGVTADLVVLPELCTTGYQFLDREELVRLAEPVDGPLARTLTDLSRRTGAVLVAGFAEAASEGIYNAAMTVTARGVVAVYRKVHLFDREKTVFLPGDRPFEPVDAGLPVPLGVMICFDWMFPEAARSLALRGAGVIAHPANLVLPWCQRAMFARAVENGVVIITANRTGTERRWTEMPLTFTGGSQVMLPDGTTPVFADATETVCRTVTIDLSRCGSRLNSRNDRFADRRPSLYATETLSEN